MENALHVTNVDNTRSEFAYSQPSRELSGPLLIRTMGEANEKVVARLTYISTVYGAWRADSIDIGKPAAEGLTHRRYLPRSARSSWASENRALARDDGRIFYEG